MWLCRSRQEARHEVKEFTEQQEPGNHEKKRGWAKKQGKEKKTESEERGRKLITQKADILLRKEETCRVGPTQASAVIWAIRKENDRKRVKLEKKTDGCLLTSRLLSIPFYLLFSVPAACNQTALHTTNNKSFLNLDGEEAVRSCQRARQIELQLFRLDWSKQQPGEDSQYLRYLPSCSGTFDRGGDLTMKNSWEHLWN